MTTHPDATEMEAAVADVLKIWDHERNAEAVTSAARLLWDALADLGMVDDFGGLQCERVLPEAPASLLLLVDEPRNELGDVARGDLLKALAITERARTPNPLRILAFRAFEE